MSLTTEQLKDVTVVASVSELTADELISQGERLLKLGRDLLAQAAHLQSLADLPEERSVGRLGVVTEPDTIRKAKELGLFTADEFGEALGVKRPAAMRWLAKLMNGQHPVVARCDDGKFRYIPPSESEAERKPSPRRPEPESEIIRRNAPVQGTGDNLRGYPSQIKALIREAQQDGWRLKAKGRGGHAQLIKDGRSITVPQTPTNADHSAAALRKALYSGREHLSRAV